MADQLDRFYGNWHDKQVPSRGGITGQCVSLVQKYLEEQFNAPGTPVFPVQYAKQMFGQRNDLGAWVANTPTGVPPRGAIMVLDGRYGGGAGHTGVVVDANQNTYRLFQQNDPYGSGAHVTEYNYNGAIGWMIPNGLGNQPTPPQGDDKMTPEQHKAAYRIVLGREAEAGAGNGGLTAWEFINQAQAELAAQRAATAQRLTDLTNRVTQLEKVVTDAQKVVTEQQKALADAGDINSKLDKQIEALNKKIDELSSGQQPGLNSYSLGELLSAAFAKLFKIK